MVHFTDRPLPQGMTEGPVCDQESQRGDIRKQKKNRVEVSIPPAVGVGQFQGPQLWAWGSFKDPSCGHGAVSRTPDVGMGQFQGPPDVGVASFQGPGVRRWLANHSPGCCPLFLPHRLPETVDLQAPRWLL